MASAAATRFGSLFAGSLVLRDAWQSLWFSAFGRLHFSPLFGKQSLEGLWAPSALPQVLVLARMGRQGWQKQVKASVRGRGHGVRMEPSESAQYSDWWMLAARVLECQSQRNWVQGVLQGLSLIVGQIEMWQQIQRLGLQGANDLLGALKYLLCIILVWKQNVFCFPLNSFRYVLCFGWPYVNTVKLVVVDRWAKLPGVKGMGCPQRMFG
jgi:hypothetical protein